jgi:hypothetical protein
MNPRAGPQDGIEIERHGRGSGGERFVRPRREKKEKGDTKDGVRPGEYPYGTGTGAETGSESPAEVGRAGVEAVPPEGSEGRPDAVLSEEHLGVLELQQPEMELWLAEALPEEQVTREFSAADAQLEVEQPEVPEVLPDETAGATLEITHEGLVGDLDHRIEPYPTERLEQEVNYDPLNDEPGPRMLPPPGDV